MDKLQSLLEDRFPGVDFANEKHLYTDGILDSINMVDIIALIEEHFGLVVTMDYLEPNNFESVESIWTMMQQLS